MDWIKTTDKLPLPNQKIEMTCKHWEKNWVGKFEYPYINQGHIDVNGDFWDEEGCRLSDPAYWRPYTLVIKGPCEIKNTTISHTGPIKFEC